MDQNNNRGAAPTVSFDWWQWSSAAAQRALLHHCQEDQRLCSHCPSQPGGPSESTLAPHPMLLSFSFISLLFSLSVWSTCSIPISANDITSFLTEMTEGPPPPTSKSRLLPSPSASATGTLSQTPSLLKHWRTWPSTTQGSIPQHVLWSICYYLQYVPLALPLPFTLPILLDLSL